MDYTNRGKPICIKCKIPMELDKCCKDRGYKQCGCQDVHFVCPNCDQKWQETLIH